MNYDDSASHFFALAVIGPYAVGAGIYLAVKTYGHFTRKPKYPEVRWSNDDVVAGVAVVSAKALVACCHCVPLDAVAV